MDSPTIRRAGGSLHCVEIHFSVLWRLVSLNTVSMLRFSSLASQISPYSPWGGAGGAGFRTILGWSESENRGAPTLPFESVPEVLWMC